MSVMREHPGMEIILQLLPPSVVLKILPIPVMKPRVSFTNFVRERTFEFKGMLSQTAPPSVLRNTSFRDAIQPLFSS